MRARQYNYNSPQIKTESTKFREYLQERQFAKGSIQQHVNYAAYFLDWLEQTSQRAEETTYNDILDFIDYCKSNEKNNRLTNRILSAVRHYYGCLSQQKIIKNPASGIYLKNIKQTVPKDLLSFEELEELYKQYRAIDERTKRNKAILGILIYQYPSTEELRRLQTTDINLKEGKIYIPGTRQSNGRMLELKPFQVMELQEYINEVRNKLIVEPTSQLFVSMEGNKCIKASLHHMFRALKKINPEVKSGMQIRMSMISHLQKTIHLRKLQYMAGHKYISSTERYKTTNTDELYKQLRLFHPLK